MKGVHGGAIFINNTSSTTNFMAIKVEVESLIGSNGGGNGTCEADRGANMTKDQIGGSSSAD